jgi:hypothetical protein
MVKVHSEKIEEEKQAAAHFTGAQLAVNDALARATLCTQSKIILIAFL